METNPCSAATQRDDGSLAVIALAISLLVFAPRWIFKVLSVIWPASYTVVPGWGFLAGMVAYLNDLILSSAALLVAMASLSLGLIAAALIWTRPRWPMRLALWSVAAAILAFPWLTAYRPAVAAAPGYEMRWLTQPGPLTGITKSAQVGAEIKPCAYSLLGWTPGGELYYTEHCGDERKTAFRFDPASSDDIAGTTETASSDLVIGSRIDITDWVRAPGVRPPSAEPATRRVYVRDGGVLSPNGDWVAVIAHYVYGPEDAIMLRSTQ